MSRFIVLITRRDSRGREYDLPIETLTNAPDGRRRRPSRLAPAVRAELPAWHDHEEDE